MSPPAVMPGRMWWSSCPQTGQSWMDGTAWTTTGSATMNGLSSRGTQPSIWRSVFASPSTRISDWVQGFIVKSLRTNMAGELKTDKGKHAGEELLFSPCGDELNIWICSSFVIACLCLLSQQNPIIPRFANRDKRSHPAPCITVMLECACSGA